MLDEITPEESVRPVFLLPPEPFDHEVCISPDELMAEQLALRESAVVSLMALGLSEEQARAIARV